MTKIDFDLLGRGTVEAFESFNPSAGSDKTTEFSYDGPGHLLGLSGGRLGQYANNHSIPGVTHSPWEDLYAA